MPRSSLVPRLRRLAADRRLRALVAVALVTAGLRLLVPGSSPQSGAARLAAPRRVPSVPVQIESPTLLRDELGRGETLSEIWDRNGRPRAEMAAVVEAATAAFDVRQLRPGTPIEIHLTTSGETPPVATAGFAGAADEASTLDSVVIRIDGDRRLVVRADGGGFRGTLFETPMRQVDRTYVGCIQTSLYAALETDREDLSPLALDLDRIFGGQIDFYSDLRPGDCVALYFQTYVRPDGSFRLGRIQAAELVNGGVRRPAVWFEAPDGAGDYFDAEGQSLRRQFLRSPLKFTRISSGFSLHRFHPILKRYRAHPGVDYAAPTGTPVQAAGNGTVAFAGWKRGYGNLIEIRHGKVYQTSYAHLSRIARGVRRGARVSQGQVIGFVGSTGLATGPHLDYRFAKNGKFVNPLNENSVSGDPVPAQYRALFAERRDRVMEPLQDLYRTVLVEAGRPEPAPALPPGARALLGSTLNALSAGDD